MPLVKQKLRWAKQVWWEPSVWKLVIENWYCWKQNIYQQKLLVPVCTFTGYILNLAVFCGLASIEASNFIPTNI